MAKSKTNVKTIQLVKEEIPNFTEQVIEARITKIRELILVKGKEYVRGGDRLHNFRRGAEVDRVTMPRALHGYLKKHLVSYLDMLDDIDKGVLPTDDLINEKIGDILVYFFLQEATIKQHKIETHQSKLLNATLIVK